MGKQATKHGITAWLTSHFLLPMCSYNEFAKFSHCQSFPPYSNPVITFCSIFLSECISSSDVCYAAISLNFASYLLVRDNLSLATYSINSCACSIRNYLCSQISNAKIEFAKQVKDHYSSKAGIFISTNQETARGRKHFSHITIIVHIVMLIPSTPNLRGSTAKNHCKESYARNVMDHGI